MTNASSGFATKVARCLIHKINRGCTLHGECRANLKSMKKTKLLSDFIATLSGR